MPDFYRNRGNDYNPAGAFGSATQFGIAEVQHLAAQQFQQNPPPASQFNPRSQTGPVQSGIRPRDYADGNHAAPPTQTTTRHNMNNLADEVSRLRSQLESTKEEIQSAYDAVDSVVEELTTTQDELEEAKQELDEKARRLDEKTRELGRKERELQAWRGNVEKLSTEIEERIQTEVSLNQRLSAVRLERAVTPQNDAELQTLRIETGKVKGELDEARGRLLSKERECETAQVELADERKRREQAEARLVELRAKQLDIAQQSESQRQIEANARDEVARAQTEAAEVRRLADFFKGNSEKMSRQNRELNANQRLLQESLQMKDRELQELANEISALRFQVGDQHRR